MPPSTQHPENVADNVGAAVGPAASCALDRLWEDYAAHHRSEGNKWCHLLGIPMIIAGLLGLLSVPVFQIQGWKVEAALLLVVLAGGFYLWLDRKLGGAMLAATLLLYLGARRLPWPADLALFLVGWGIQFVGHGIFEKRSPAFLDNLAHLLVGPLWVLNYLLKLRPHRRP